MLFSKDGEGLLLALGRGVLCWPNQFEVGLGPIWLDFMRSKLVQHGPHRFQNGQKQLNIAHRFHLEKLILVRVVVPNRPECGIPGKQSLHVPSDTKTEL